MFAYMPHTAASCHLNEPYNSHLLRSSAFTSWNFNTLKIVTCYIICRLTLAALDQLVRCVCVCVCMFSCWSGEREQNNKIKLVIFISKNDDRNRLVSYPLSDSYSFFDWWTHIPSIHLSANTYRTEWQIRTAKCKSQSSQREFIFTTYASTLTCCFTFRSKRKICLNIIYIRVSKYCRQ